ncbi:MAG: hypothetical protein LBD93_01660 [Treponema sp.]|jgi:hypothetical protein|nr:hypothetical protein [Treponema sp.]
MDFNRLKTDKIGAFFDGFASAFDLSGQTFISLPDLDSGFQHDREALKGDWEAVGTDLGRAMNIVAHEP